MSNIIYKCYICKTDIESGVNAQHPLDPCVTTLIGHYDKERSEQKEQQFFCHAKCFSSIVSDNSLMYIMESDFCTIGEIESEQ